MRDTVFELLSGEISACLYRREIIIGAETDKDMFIYPYRPNFSSEKKTISPSIFWVFFWEMEYIQRDVFLGISAVLDRIHLIVYDESCCHEKGFFVSRIRVYRR